MHHSTNKLFKCFAFSIFALLKTKTMKKFLIILAVGFIFSSCKKDDSTNNTPSTNVYVNTADGSSWSYHETDLSGTNPDLDYTVTSTSEDTTINSRKYHVYSYSYGGHKYMGMDGHDYYEYDSIPITGGINIDRLYLKDASEGEAWQQNFPLTIPGVPVDVVLTVQNKITEKGISKTVNGKSFSDVIHVTTTLSAAGISDGALSTSIESYYAPNYGLIENTTMIQLNYFGIVENVNLKTELMSSDLK
jgi:hypothetical protein